MNTNMVGYLHCFFEYFQSIILDFSNFNEELNYLKNVLKNFFPTTLVDKCINMFLDKQFSQKI